MVDDTDGGPMFSWLVAAQRPGTSVTGTSHFVFVFVFVFRRCGQTYPMQPSGG